MIFLGEYPLDARKVAMIFLWEIRQVNLWSLKLGVWFSHVGFLTPFALAPRLRAHTIGLTCLMRSKIFDFYYQLHRSETSTWVSTIVGKNHIGSGA